MKKLKRWSYTEEKFLKENYKAFSLTDLAKKLNRSYKAVSIKLNRFKLNKKPSYTPKDEIFILENYPKLSIKEIAKKLNRSTKTLYEKLFRMKISIYKCDLINSDYITLSKALKILKISDRFIKLLEKKKFITILKNQKTRLLKNKTFEKLKSFKENFITISEVAKSTFYHQKTIRRFIKTNKIPKKYIKVFGRRYFLHKESINIIKAV